MADERASREDLLQAALGQETVTGVDIKKVVIPKEWARANIYIPAQ